jgi:hypothetical protein
MHTCIANTYKHQGRCSICGKFMSAPLNSTQAVTSANIGNGFTKEEVLTKLRSGTYEVSYSHNGMNFFKTFSLESKYLGNYIGSGKSALTDDDTLLLYDVHASKFRKLSVKDINTMDEK